MPGLYFDNCVARRVAHLLVTAGYDVVTAAESGLRSAPDGRQLLVATQQHRVLVSHNVDGAYETGDASLNRQNRGDVMATKPLPQYDVHETPGVAGGYPCVGNTRIPVRVIVEHVRAGASIERIHAMYPQLTAAQVQDALAYYEDYPARVDEDIRINAEAFAALQRR